ncbi:hypothetical protein O3P69_001389 [Scylla paramamosain]|uniref:Uncharacterized protein n=1 Tax=Scylla paramamosain TaxID=85552 RepID=A0AAW0UUL3_SCYPA
MAKVLLLLILTVIYEGAAQTNDCDHIDQDLKDGDVELVASGSFIDSQKEIDVYFKMDDVNLKDVRINLQERNGNQQSEWFPFDDGCSQHGNHSEWRMLKVSYTTDSIRVSVSTENYSCQSRCLISSPWQLPLDFCVIASGPSQWLWKWSSNCSPTFKTFNGTSKYSTLSTYIAPKTTLFAAMVVMIVLSVMALVLLASVVLIVWWKKAAASASRNTKGADLRHLHFPTHTR